MNEKWPKDFRNFLARRKEVCIASWGRRDAQLIGLVELERRCQDKTGKTHSE